MVKPGRIEIREFPYSTVADNAMLMKVELSGICGTDKHTFRGETRQYVGTKAETSIPFPIIPGHEIVGTIVEVGNHANKAIKTYEGQIINEGDRVVICPDILCDQCYYCMNYAGFVVCDNTKKLWNNYIMRCTTASIRRLGTYVYKVPETIPPKVAILTELMAVTYNLDKAKEFYSMSGEGFKTGDTVVIPRCGANGTSARDQSTNIGGGCDSSEFRLNMAKEYGADVVLNIRNTTQADRIEAVKDLTHGRGADIVVECTGVPAAIPEGLKSVCKREMYMGYLLIQARYQLILIETYVQKYSAYRDDQPSAVWIPA